MSKPASFYTGEWSKEDVRDLKKMFPNNSTLEVADELHRPIEGVKKKASRLGLKKSRRYLKSLGRVVAILLVCCLWSATVRAGDDAVAAGNNWTVSVVGNDDLLSVRVGTRPWTEKTEIGLYGVWQDGLQPDGEEAWGGGVYATYDVAHGEFAILQMQVPIVWYVGGMAGFLSPDPIKLSRHTIDASASLLTGLSFGGEKVRIGVEYLYALSPSLWKELAEVDPQGEILLCLAYRF